MATGIAAPGDRRRYSETAALKELGGYPKWFGDGAPIPTLIDSIVWQRFMKATGGRRTARSWSAPIFEPGTLGGAERSYSESPLQRRMTC